MTAGPIAPDQVFLTEDAVETQAVIDTLADCYDVEPTPSQASISDDQHLLPGYNDQDPRFNISAA
eukprot:6980803-Heterocapsa_arctica.AAC.1